MSVSLLVDVQTKSNSIKLVTWTLSYGLICLCFLTAIVRPIAKITRIVNSNREESDKIFGRTKLRTRNDIFPVEDLDEAHSITIFKLILHFTSYKIAQLEDPTYEGLYLWMDHPSLKARGSYVTCPLFLALKYSRNVLPDFRNWSIWAEWWSHKGRSLSAQVPSVPSEALVQVEYLLKSRQQRPCSLANSACTKTTTLLHTRENSF